MIRYIKYIMLVLTGFGLIACDGTVTNNLQKEEGIISSQDLSAVTNTGSQINKTSGIMMQGFFWNVPAGGNWWNTIASKVDTISNMAGGYGIDMIWLPPFSKAQGGEYSMGYDPYDYYDLGNYNQKGTIETRFGSKSELQNLISTLHNNNINVMADIVLNHRSGGDNEFNPNTNDSTYTDFSGVASGKNTWHFDSFHPNSTETSDAGSFAGFPDVAYKQGSAYNDMIGWLNWLRSDIAIDAYRFDFVKGLFPWVVKDMINNTNPVFSVGEFFDSNVNTLDWWTDEVPNASAFDFGLYFTMRDIFNDTSGGGYLPNLIDPAKSLAAREPLQAVTFAGNHDIDEIVNDKMMAYAFILTYQGFPTIWWKDYFNFGLDDLGGKWGNGINQLVWVRGQLAAAGPTIELLKTNDGDLLIYGANGVSSTSPGYIVVINDHPSAWKGAGVQTGNTHLHDKTLKVYAWHSTVDGQNVQPDNESVDASGNVEVWAPPRGYAVYSVDGL